MKVTIQCILAVLAVLLLGWLLMGHSLLMYGVFAPMQERVRREVFEQTKSFNQGMIQELQNMQFEYVKASPEHKAALASIILHRAADYEVDKLPADLRAFVMILKSEYTNH